MAKENDKRIEKTFIWTRIGRGLRDGGSDIVKEELPAEMVRLLRELEAIDGGAHASLAERPRAPG